MPRRLPLLLLVLLIATETSSAAEAPRTTYTVEYQVRISPKTPSIARVRWKFTGIDEVEYLRLKVDKTRFYDFSGTGTLSEKGTEILWTPQSPYAHLEYKVRLRHRRSPEKGYDTYATKQWVITRTKALFPPVRVSIDRKIEPNPLPRSRLVFRLPSGWEAYSMMEPAGPLSFRPPRSGRFLDRPSGWLALGHLEVERREIAGTTVTIARPPRSALDAKAVLDLYERALPVLRGILEGAPPRLLVVSGPNPMWRGGISGMHSFYIHGDRPLRTPDRTSPVLHELFHVLAPFRSGDDGKWITEGLAEYYSVALQHRVGALTDRDLGRALRLFERYGEWNVNLAAQRNLAATNNSAPLVIYAIDRALRTKTKEERSLDDVVRLLVESGGPVTTAGFLRAVNSVGEQNFTPFFQRHVYAGVAPEIGEIAGSRKKPPKPKS